MEKSRLEKGGFFLKEITHALCESPLSPLDLKQARFLKPRLFYV